MSQVTISLPRALDTEVRKRVRGGGFRSKAAYLLDLVQADCERDRLESILEDRIDGPFAPLEADWKQRVRDAASSRG
jgi:Arc/MetJ-type ribon-helix-helix transcriptional regulator